MKKLDLYSQCWDEAEAFGASYDHLTLDREMHINVAAE